MSQAHLSIPYTSGGLLSEYAESDPLLMMIYVYTTYDDICLNSAPETCLDASLVTASSKSVEEDIIRFVN